MKALYVIILALIAVIISYYIVSAFVLQQQAVNKQSFYVHLQPEWNSRPGNIVYEVTNVWTREGNETPLDPDARLELSKQANVDEVRSVHNKSYILVRHGNSNCHDVWEPHYARFGADTIRHHIEYAMGLQKSPDPAVNMYALIPSKQSADEHDAKIKGGYSQFIPICTEKETTSFDYSVKINDEYVGFDVYFVPSEEEQKNYDENNGKFEHYGDGQCSGKNYARFSGTCNNVGKNSGLLIVLPDNMSLPLTKVEVWLYEREQL